MRLQTGDALGPCIVRALIGAGGMGEVYRASDSRLGRDVAIKVLAVRHLDLVPGDARALSLGSVALFRDGQVEQALRWSDRALELHPDDLRDDPRFQAMLAKLR